MSQSLLIYTITIILIIILIVVVGSLVLVKYFPKTIKGSSSNIQRSIENKPLVPTDWQLIDTESFQLHLPHGWKYNRLPMPEDSFVGEFIGDEMRLGFDFGVYSNPLEYDEDPNHVVTYEDIDGHRAKIVVSKVAGSGSTGVYFDNLGENNESTLVTDGGSTGIYLDNRGENNKFTLSGGNFTPPQQEMALKIIRTVKFKK